MYQQTLNWNFIHL